MKGLLGRLGGPLISVILHIAIFVVLIKVLVFRAPEKEQAIDVQVVKDPVRELEPVEQEKPPQDSAESESLDAPEELATELLEDPFRQDSMLESEIDLSGLETGIYLVRFHSDQMDKIVRIIKE